MVGERSRENMVVYNRLEFRHREEGLIVMVVLGSRRRRTFLV